MPTKDYIFENVATFTAEQLVEFIRNGIVTLQELEDSNNTYGDFSSDMRTKVSSMINNSEPNDWTRALQVNTVEAFQNYLDTYSEGPHRDEARDRIQALLSNTANSSFDQSWNDVDKDDINALQSFIDNNPHSPHLSDAIRLRNIIRNRQTTRIITSLDIVALERKIKNIQADRSVLDPASEIFSIIKNCIDQNSVSIQDLLNSIAKDKNLLNASVIHRLYDEGYISQTDLTGMGIGNDFILHMLEDVMPQRFEEPDRLEQINKRSTEVYFWGIPSSGKSCALGAILSVANNGICVRYMEKDNDCQGYGYMSRLMVQFRNDGSVCTLPEGTSIYSTYEMGFNLIDNGGIIHPITCIDLAGELVRCMYKSDSGETMSEDEIEALTTINDILVDQVTNNRKMHFFVIEYGAEDRLYEGMPQQSYLDAALQYIKRTRIFEKDTVAVYLMITKVDKIPNTKDRNSTLREYLENNYLGFVNGLKTLCKNHEINGGNVEIIPFSLGEVCFQNYCRFHGDHATRVVEKIIQRTDGYKNNKMSKFKNLLKG